MGHSTASTPSNASVVDPSPSPSIHSRASSHEPDDRFSREEMLKVLASQTLAQFEIEGLSSADQEYDDEEEWGGIPSEEENQDDEDYSTAASDEDFDDGEDLLLTSQKDLSGEPQKPQQGPEVVVFQDPSKASSKGLDCDTTIFEKKSFMASMLQKQNRNATPSGGSNAKRKQSSNQEEEEAKLEHLDRSLSNLVSHLSGPKKTTVSLDTILSSTLPPPAKDKNSQRHPRRIKEGMARAHLERSLAADKEALVSGTVRAKNSQTLTKRQKRAQDGTTDRDRRARKALADRGSIGKTVGGGMIKLSSREIKMGMNGSKSRGKGSMRKR